MDYRDMVESHATNNLKETSMSDTILDLVVRLQMRVISASPSRSLRCQKTIPIWGTKARVRITAAGTTTIEYETSDHRFYIRYADNEMIIKEHWIKDLDGSRKVWNNKRRDLMTITALGKILQELGITVN